MRTWLPTKAYLLQHTTLLPGFTRDFQKLGTRYHALAQATSFDYARLWATRRAEVSSLLRKAKSAWIEGNPYYERAEGIVAGTPSHRDRRIVGHAGTAVETGAAGETGGGIEGGAAVAVFDVDFGAVVGKELDDLVEALLGSAEESGAAVAVGGIDIDSGGQAELDGFDDVGLRLHAAGRICIACSDAGGGHQRSDAIARCEFRDRRPSRTAASSRRGLRPSRRE